LEVLMDKGKTILQLACAGLALWFGLIGCSLLSTTSVNEVRNETQAIDLGSASSAKVVVDFSAGQLKVAGGTDKLMEATFRYNVDDWKPQINYNVNGSQGELVVNNPRDNNKLPVGREVINEWDIRLNNGVPLDLEIGTGAGESNLDLSALDASSLQVNVGAGNTDLDLSGNWDHDVNADVTGGVGKLSIQLPAEMGVRVSMDTGLVNVTANGLIIEEGGYVNKAFGSAAHTLTLNLHAGVGSVVLTVPQP
jgi:N-terminal domain of toast_rack, DUF2154